MDTDENRIDGQTSGGRGMTPEGVDARFYSTAEFNQRLDLIRHLIRNSDRTLLIRGDSGVGKSTLLAHLQRLADAEWQICRIDATPMLQPDQLLYQLALCLKVEPEAGGLLRRLQRRIEDLYQTRRLPLILVDDAQLLPLPSLIVLFRLQERSGHGILPLRLVLSAVPQIDDVLRTPQLQAMNAQSVQQIDLLPLNLQQTVQLAQQIIQDEGGAGTAMPSDSQLARIYRDSRGLPGGVERLARQLASGKASTRPAPTAGRVTGIPRSVLAGAAVLLLLIVLTLIYQDQINALFQGQELKDESPLASGIDDQRIVPLTLPERPETKVEEPAVSEVAQEQPRGDPMTTDIPVAIPPGLALPELDLPAESSPATIVDESVVLKPAVEVVLEAAPTDAPGRSMQSPAERAGVPGPGSSKQAAEKADAAQPPVAAPVEEMPRPKPAAERAEKEGQHTVTEATAAPVLDRSEPVPVATGKKAAKVVEEPVLRPAQPAPVSTPERNDEVWLLQQNPSRFTLQLVGVQDEKSARAFIRQNHLQETATYFRTSRNGRPWFSVVYGVYPNRGEAVAARSRLPRKLAKSGVWPRTLASVQEAIRTR